MAASQILILGARGMVASAIAAAAGKRALVAARPPISGKTLQYDALTSDLTSLLEALETPPSAVVIAFGVSGVHTCAVDPIGSRRVNVDSVLAAARTVADFGAVPVLFSTDSVFDGTPKLWSEKDTPAPLNEYGRQKATVEQEIERLRIPYLMMRLSRVIADHAHHRDLLFEWCNLIHQEQPIKVAIDQNFTPIAATDLGPIALALIDANVRGLINVAGPQRISSPELIEMLRTALRQVGANSHFEIERCRVADLPGIDYRPPNTMLDIEKLDQLLAPRFQPLSETVHSVAAAAFARESTPNSN
jgi:dTDP-4-dehydrorhamnose reductase